MMVEKENPSHEEGLARELNEEIARGVARRRLWSGLLAACLIAIGVLLTGFALYAFAFAACGVAVAFGILCLDAHGHVQEVRSRSSRSLAPRLSEVFGKGPARSQAQDAPQRPA